MSEGRCLQHLCALVLKAYINAFLASEVLAARTGVQCGGAILIRSMVGWVASYST